MEVQEGWEQITHAPKCEAKETGLHSRDNAGTSPAVQWLRLRAPSAGGRDSIPGQETKSRMRAATKTRHS